jgi:hypothetical protein
MSDIAVKITYSPPPSTVKVMEERSLIWKNIFGDPSLNAALVAYVAAQVAAGGGTFATLGGDADDNASLVAYVAAQITAMRDALVNGAGAALDQLNELSAALNDDPDFGATVVAELAAINAALALKAGVNDAMIGRTIVKSTARISHTGTTTPTKIFSQPVAGTTLAAWDFVQMIAMVVGTTNANNKIIRLKVNTIDSLVGAVTVATYTTTSTAGRFIRNIKVLDTSQIEVGSTTTSYQSDMGTSFAVGNFNQPAYNPALTYYWILEMELANAADSFTLIDFRMTHIR